MNITRKFATYRDRTNTTTKGTSMMSVKRITFALVAILVLAAAFASSASAGTYNVHSCKLPSGQPAPTNGWSALGQTNTCSTGGNMSATSIYLNETPIALWKFNSGGLPIKAFSIWRTFSASSFGSPSIPTSRVYYTLASRVGGSPALDQHDMCFEAFTCTNIGTTPETELLSISGAAIPENTTSIETRTGCFVGTTDYAGCTVFQGFGGFGRSSSLDIKRAVVTLEENVPPVVSNVSGTLPASAEHKGVETFAFDLSDDYSGVYNVDVLVNGAVVETIVPNTNGGRCIDVDGTNASGDFTHIQPCLDSAVVSSVFNTKNYGDGYYAFKITATDAAGNEATVFNEPNFLIKNNQVKPGIGNGTGGNNGNGGNLTTARFAANSANIVRVNYNAKKSLPNRLVDAAGKAISGAQVDVYEHVNVAGAIRAKITTVVTDADGYVSYMPRATSNKLITFSWAATRGSADYAISDNVTMIVKGAISLKLAKRKIRAGGRMNLKGVLRGEDMKRRIPVEILTKDGKRWRVVAVVNTKPNGKFNYRYKFKFVRNAKFQFKARVRGSSDLSVEPGSSRAVKLRVG